MAEFKETLAETLETKIAEAKSQGFTRIRMWTQDEARVGLNSIVRHRITAKGVQPVISSEIKRQYFYLFGAIEPATGEDFMLEMPRLDGGIFQVFLDEFAKLDESSYHLLVVDNATAHTSGELKVPKNIGFIFLPPNAPELNPIERFWRDLKDWLSDYEPQILTDLSELITTGLSKFSTTRIRSITSYEYLMKAWEAAIA